MSFVQGSDAFAVLTGYGNSLYCDESLDVALPWIPFSYTRVLNIAGNIA